MYICLSTLLRLVHYAKRPSRKRPKLEQSSGTSTAGKISEHADVAGEAQGAFVVMPSVTAGKYPSARQLRAAGYASHVQSNELFQSCGAAERHGRSYAGGVKRRVQGLERWEDSDDAVLRDRAVTISDGPVWVDAAVQTAPDEVLHLHRRHHPHLFQPCLLVGRLNEVRELAVHMRVQTALLGGRRDAKAHRVLEAVQQRSRHRHRQRRDHHHGEDLHAQLLRVAVEQAVVAGGVDRFGGEAPGQDGSDHATDTVGREDVEGVIEEEALAEADGVERAKAADPSNDDLRPGLHVSARRRAADHTYDGGDCELRGVGLPFVESLEDHPHNARAADGDLRVHSGVDCDRVGHVQVAAIETEPAEPQQRRAEQHCRHVVRRKRLVRFLALANDQCRRQSAGTGRQVHDDATTEVEDAHVTQPAELLAGGADVGAGPDPMGGDVIDDGAPEDDEDHVGLEVHAADDGAGDEGGRDDGEHHLVEHVQQVGNRWRVVQIRVTAHVIQRTPPQVAVDEDCVFGERDRIPEQEPL
mmetsp:Transcript_27370/g.47257  ORF Transcript_27370/g.47257 Transcript_27370/m.47257 type:complete len:527 (+) Transcript_27370:316-1896(+)